MSDNFIDEIKEEIRNDQIQRIWNDYGTIIIGAIVGIILATIGYIIWHNYQENTLKAHALAYEESLEKNASGLSEDISQGGFAALKTKSSKGYRILSSYMAVANQSAMTASQELSKLASAQNNHAFYDDLAALQAIMRKFDITTSKDLLKELSEFENKTPAIYAQSIELKGYTYLKLKNIPQALDSFQKVLNHPSATQAMTLRARAMVEMISGS